MRKFLSLGAALAALCVMPSIASAQDPAAGAASGALTGAAVGAVVGGPIGAVVGAGVGGTVGAAATDAPRGPVVEERVYVAPAPATRERNCVRDAAGTVICEEIRR
jgi:uncharacterized protein YcfJ